MSEALASHNYTELLGKSVTDRCTGFKGTCTGHVERIDGSHDLCVETVDKQGILRSDWINAERMGLTSPSRRSKAASAAATPEAKRSRRPRA